MMRLFGVVLFRMGRSYVVFVVRCFMLLCCLILIHIKY